MYEGNAGATTRSATPVPMDRMNRPVETPLTPLQSRVSDFAERVARMEELSERLYRRFDHLIPSLPPGAESTSKATPDMPKSACICALDALNARMDRCLNGLDRLMSVVEA